MGWQNFLPLLAGDLELNFLGTLIENLLVATKIQKNLKVNPYSNVKLSK